MQQEKDGKIARWKRPPYDPQVCKFFLEGRCNRGTSCTFLHEGVASGRSRASKQKENKKRGQRRLRLEEKHGAQQRERKGAGAGPVQAPEPDGAVLEPAESPVQELRERSRRPRDTRSQSRSHSARRSPRR